MALRADREPQPRAVLPEPSRTGQELAALLDHEVRSTLFAIEASAVALQQYRSSMGAAQADELIDALVAEIRRTRAMLEGRSCERGAYDVAEAFGPVIAGARALGLEVHSSITRGIAVLGRSDNAAQVLFALLDNVAKHAGTSDVDLRVAVHDDEVRVFVEDRGAGIPPHIRPCLFERGACGDRSTGSGLGLHIVASLMADEDGAILVHSRRGGGTSVELRFRRPAP